MSALDQDDVADGTSYKRLSAAKKTLLDSITDAGSGVVISATERAKVAYIDTNESLTTSLAGKISSTGSQSISQSGSTPVLTLTNNNSDQQILKCIGPDGQLRLTGGNVVECIRENGSMQIRNNAIGGSVVLIARTTNSIIIDDKVTVPVSFALTKAAPSGEDDAGTPGEIRVSGNTLYLYSSATSKWRTISSEGWA